MIPGLETYLALINKQSFLLIFICDNNTVTTVAMKKDICLLFLILNFFFISSQNNFANARHNLKTHTVYVYIFVTTNSVSTFVKLKTMA